jgi:DNA-binding transcriptional LysR family regulator
MAGGLQRCGVAFVLAVWTPHRSQQVVGCGRGDFPVLPICCLSGIGFGVLSLGQLAVLDLYLWLEREAAVAELLDVHQSSISRHVRSALKTMELRLDAGGAHRTLLGDQELLAGERGVHQLARLRGRAPLRIDATYSSGPWLLSSPPAGWLVGRFHLPGLARPLELLRDRVIDAWVGSYQPDLPGPDDPEWWVLDLLREPVQLLAAPDHPLAGEKGLQPGDFDAFPSLALPTGWFPQTEQILRNQGLWHDIVRLQRYDPSSWEGRCADGVTLTYGQSLTEALQPTTVRLDWNLGLTTGEALVVRRDLLDQAPIQRLAEHLQRQARTIAELFPDVEVVV